MSISLISRSGERVVQVPERELRRLDSALSAYKAGGEMLYELMGRVGPGLAWAVNTDMEILDMDWCAVEGLLAQFYSVKNG